MPYARRVCRQPYLCSASTAPFRPLAILTYSPSAESLSDKSPRALLQRRRIPEEPRDVRRACFVDSCDAPALLPSKVIFKPQHFIHRLRYRAACRQSQLAPSPDSAHQHTTVTLALQRQNSQQIVKSDNGRKPRSAASPYGIHHRRSNDITYVNAHAPQFCILAQQVDKGAHRPGRDTICGSIGGSPSSAPSGRGYPAARRQMLSGSTAPDRTASAPPPLRQPPDRVQTNGSLKLWQVSQQAARIGAVPATLSKPEVKLHPSRCASQNCLTAGRLYDWYALSGQSAQPQRCRSHPLPGYACSASNAACQCAASPSRAIK